MRGLFVVLLALCCLPLSRTASAADWTACNQNDDYDRKVRACTQLIESGPRKCRHCAYNNRGFAYFRKYDYDRAIADYSEAIRLVPSYVRGYLNRGQAYAEKRDWVHAEADIEKALRLSPKSAEAYNFRAYFHNHKGEYDKAIADSERAIALNPKYAPAYNNRGWSYRLKGDFDRALADLEKATRLDAKLIHPYLNRTNIYLQKNDWDRAIANCERGLRLQPKSPTARNCRASIHLRRGEYDQAIARADEALQVAPRFPAAYVNRGNARIGKGDFDGGFADFEQALGIDPQHAGAYASRGYAYGGRGSYAKAFADLDNAVSLDPRAAQHYLRRGQIHAASGDDTQAVADYDEALRLSPILADAADEKRAALQRMAATSSSPKEAAATAATPAQAVPAPAAPAQPEQRAEAAVVAAAAPAQPEPATPAPATLGQPAPGRKVALVVGNSNYRNVGALPNATKDAAAITAALKRLGFEVMEYIDLDERGMRHVLSAFEDKVEGANWALVYYAGHGMEMDGRNWLVPVDARLRRSSDVADETIDLERVLDRVRPAKRLRIVLLDACRNNPFLARMTMNAGRTRALQRGLAQIEPEHGEVVFYAARHGTTAEDGTADHSPFTAALLKYLSEPGLEIGLFFRKVTSEVLASTSPKQEPFVYGRIPAENFYFIPPQ